MATKKKKTRRKAATFEKPGEVTFGDVLRAIFGGEVAGHAMAQKTELEPEWQKACDTLVAALRSHELRTGGVCTPRKALEASVKRNLPRAREIFGLHPENAPPCHCRTFALIRAGCESASRRTGAPVEVLLHANCSVLENYLASRN
jgi:hypothetical protein